MIFFYLQSSATLTLREEGSLVTAAICSCCIALEVTFPPTDGIINLGRAVVSLCFG